MCWLSTRVLARATRQLIWAYNWFHGYIKAVCSTESDSRQGHLREDRRVSTVGLDENILAVIPEASKARDIRVSNHGASYWTRTACVQLLFSNGVEKKYFLKYASERAGRGMMEGEFESMKVVHSVTPDFAPRPIAWGTLQSNRNMHFLLCDFHEMDGDLPNRKIFTRRLAQLHTESTSPNRKFGFHVTTYNGNIPQDVRWTDTWEECFVNGTRKDFELEREARGPCEELERLMDPLFKKVIPRLLRPLETGGRTLKPCFVHGDLWHGNAANDISTGNPMVFDAAGFYAHHEFDIKAMRISRYRFGQDYMAAYHSHVPISEPKADMHARLALYSLRSYLHESTLFVTEPKHRQELIDEIRKLVKMFPEGLDGYVEKGAR